MRDFPVFTTENGVGSLTLREIPYQKKAYIRIHDAANPEAFLEECIQFCQIAGADEIYADGHACLDRYPIYTEIWKMQAQYGLLVGEKASLFPVMDETKTLWRNLYNERMTAIPNAAYMTEEETDKYIHEGEAYFVHENKKLIGLGVADDSEIKALISLVPGKGEKVLLSLQELITQPVVTLEVASANKKAVRLYERLGFVKIGQTAIWRTVFVK